MPSVTWANQCTGGCIGNITSHEKAHALFISGVGVVFAFLFSFSFMFFFYVISFLFLFIFLCTRRISSSEGAAYGTSLYHRSHFQPSYLLFALSAAACVAILQDLCYCPRNPNPQGTSEPTYEVHCYQWSPSFHPFSVFL